jgi:hypothetical protein
MGCNRADFNFIGRLKSLNSSVDIATKESEFETQKGQDFSLLHVVQTGSGVHPTSYPMGTGGGKVAGV